LSGSKEKSYDVDAPTPTEEVLGRSGPWTGATTDFLFFTILIVPMLVLISKRIVLMD
jgi:hypothetical protein